MHKWVLCICVAMICGTIFHMITPNGSMKKIMKLVLNVFLVSSLVMPLVKNFNCLNIVNCFGKIDKNMRASEFTNNDLAKIDEQNLINALKIVLMKNGYNRVDISIDINKDSSSDTDIYLRIPKSENYDINSIKQVVEKETGLSPKISYYQ